jgi:DNA-binding Lrp family transcriptional regulator
MNERLLTESKIASFLSVSTFTFEQLWKVSRIHRNILRYRLNDLAKRGIVIKHRYAIPYNRELYGYMYKYPIPYMTPLYDHAYFLLYYSKPESKRLIAYYYKHCKNVKPSVFPKRSISQKLCKSQENFMELQKEVLDGFKRRSTMSDQEYVGHWHKDREMLICLSRFRHQNQITAVRKCVKLGKWVVSRGILESVKKVTEFFSKRNYSFLDVLIRCSTDHNILFIDSWSTDSVLELTFVPYYVLWNIMEKEGLIKNN